MPTTVHVEDEIRPPIPLESMCESPSVPKGKFHIVVGGYNDTEKELTFSGQSEKNYLWDLGLTNADIIWYRRIDPHKPLRRPIEGPCGMTLHEKLLFIIVCNIFACN